MSDLKGDDYERAFYRDWNAGKVIDGNGKRMVPEREWQRLTDDELQKLRKQVEELTELFHLQSQRAMDYAGMAMRKREWVGLTIEERTDIRRRIQEYTPMDDIKYGEAVQFFTEEALKEKNT